MTEQQPEPTELPLINTDASIARAAALFQLAEDATAELDRWTDETVREELAHVSATLDAAAIASLDASEVYGWAWTKAGAAFIQEYKNRRELIAQLGPSDVVVSQLCLAKVGTSRKPKHELCADCACWCHTKGSSE
jgi:hypothetical protein